MSDIVLTTLALVCDANVAVLQTLLTSILAQRGIRHTILPAEVRRLRGGGVSTVPGEGGVSRVPGEGGC